MELFYCGYSEDKERWEVFLATPETSSPEETGYADVVGAFDTREEAEEYADTH